MCLFMYFSSVIQVTQLLNVNNSQNSHHKLIYSSYTQDKNMSWINRMKKAKIYFLLRILINGGNILTET